MQWRMVDLLALVAALALTLALFRVHPAAAVASCPGVLGPIAGAAAIRSARAAIAGFAVALLATLAVLALLLHLFLLITALNLGVLIRQAASLFVPLVAYLAAAVASLVGGYFGGRASGR